MDGLRAWLRRTGVTRAEVPGLAVASLGALVAVLIALRLPVAAGLSGWTGAATAGVPATDAADAADGPTVTLTPAADAVSDRSGPPATLVVHVAGAVLAPGVVELPSGARVADALAAVGGPTDDAALDAVNLARPVVDGEQVHLPTLAEVAAGVVASAPSGASTAGAGPDAGQLPDGRIDLNAADASQLEALPGIGPVLAGRIVAHRDDAGPFDEAAALREVAGIGEAIWRDVRDLVGVAGEAPP